LITFQQLPGDLSVHREAKNRLLRPCRRVVHRRAHSPTDAPLQVRRRHAELCRSEQISRTRLPDRRPPRKHLSADGERCHHRE
jgi:hypothetical protein